MPNLIQSAQYTEQPEGFPSLNRSWASRGLRSLYLPDSVQPRDLSGFNRHSSDFTTTAKLDVDTAGRVWNFGSGTTTSRLVAPTGAINGSGGVTWVAVVKATSFASTPSVACSDVTASGGLQWRFTAGGAQEMVCPGVSVFATDTATIALNTWAVIACSIAVTTPTSCQFATDGELGASPAVGNQTVGNNSGAIGERHTGSSQPWAGSIALFACFDRLFSSDELQSITANPWQLFEMPARRWWPVDTSAPAANNAIYYLVA